MCTYSKKYQHCNMYNRRLRTKSWCIIYLVSFLIASSSVKRTGASGEDIKLQCRYPDSTKNVRWLKDNKPLKLDDHKRLLKRNGKVVLKIKKLEESDIGLYSCIDSDSKSIIQQYDVTVKGMGIFHLIILFK